MPLQFRRGTDSDRLGITPSIGEPIYTTDSKALYIGDGSTVGGVRVSGTDSAAIEQMIDSAYVQARQTPQDFAYSSLTGTPTNISEFTNDAGYTTYDSANTTGMLNGYATETYVDNAVAALPDSAEVATIVTSYGYATQTYVDAAVDQLPDSSQVQEIITTLVDSAYVQARQTPQDFAYSSLTGAPTNVSSFTNDAGYTTYDSANATGQITAAIDALINGAPGALDTLNELAAALGDDANFATTVTNAIAALPDSAEVQAIATTLVDSAYVQSRQTPQDFAYSSLTGAPTNVSSFTNDANYLDSNTVTGVIDATYINSLVTATDSAAVINIVTDTVDSAYVTARIPEIPSVTVSGTAPASPTEGDLWYDNVTTGQLYTYVGTSWLSTAGLTTLQFSSIADLADVDSSAPTDGQYLTWNSATSQYVPTTLDAGTDSATVVSIVTSTIDSSYTITGDVDNTDITTYFLNYKNTGYQIFADEGGWLYIRGTDTDKDIIVRTNASGSGENDFVFGKDASLTLPGSLVFQDATVQTTAYNTIAVTADINNVVDSAYVQSRQDFDYNSLINVPANVSDFSNDANYIATGDSAALASLTTTGNVVIGGNLQVNGTTVTVNSTDLNVTDNMIYMNAGESAGSPTASIDVGWAANVNDQGSYYHVGLFRDATDQTFKVYHQYTPEPDAAAQINTGDASFALAPFAASTLTGKYLGFDSDVTAAGLATQTYVTSTIDSAYINARVSATDSAAVISIITDTVDSAYVNGLVTIPSGVTVSGTAPASPTEGDLWYDNVTTGQLYTYVGTSWLSTAGLTTLQFSSIADLSDVDSSAPTEGQYLAWNSATSQYVPTTLAAGTDSGTVVGIVTSTVDSAYVQARQTAQDFAYSSLTGAPTTVSTFTNDANYLDSNTVTGVIDAAYIQANQTAQDFAYSSLTGAPTNVSSFTNDAGYLTTAIDSTGVTSLINAAVAALVDTAPTTLDTLNELAAALGDDANFATTVTTAIAAKLDSAQTIALIDSAYINARVDAVGGGLDSAAAITIITDTVDSAYIQARTDAMGLMFRQFTYTADSGDTTFSGTDDNGSTLTYVAGKIEVFYNGVLLSPADYTATDGTTIVFDNPVDSADTIIVSSYTTTSALDSAAIINLATDVIDSAYINARVSATDSATVVSLITSTVDSAYINARVDAVGGGLDSAAVNGLITSAVGSTILAYDANLQSFVTAFTLPTTDGSSGQVLTTNGTGTISWSTVSGGGGGAVDSASITNIVNETLLTLDITSIVGTDGQPGDVLQSLGNGQATWQPNVSLSYEFKIIYDVTAISEVLEFPDGWSIDSQGTDTLLITHNTGRTPKSLSFTSYQSDGTMLLVNSPANALSSSSAAEARNSFTLSAGTGTTSATPGTLTIVNLVF